MIILMDSLIRRRSVALYLELPRNVTIAEAAKRADVSRQHASKLVRTWLINGFIQKVNNSFEYTKRGKNIADNLQYILQEEFNNV